MAVEKIYDSRCCDPAELDDVELRNAVHENNQSLQYLVHGKFQKDERDIRGYFAMHYLTVDQNTRSGMRWATRLPSLPSRSTSSR